MRTSVAMSLGVLLAVSLLLAACGQGDTAVPSNVRPVVTTSHPDEPVEEEAESVARRYQGVILDASGRAVPSALFTFGRGRIEMRVRADALGQFDVSVPVEADRSSWSLVAAAPGYGEREVGLPIMGSSGLEIVLKEDRHRASVSLRLLMPDGTPAAGAWVSVPNGPTPKGRIGGPHTLRDWFPSRGRADEQGAFVTHGILVGEVSICAQIGDCVTETTLSVVWPEVEAEVRLHRGRLIQGRVRVECDATDCGAAHEVELRIWNLRRMAFWPSLRARVETRGRDSVPFEIRGAPLGGLRLAVDVPCKTGLRFEIPAASGTDTVDLGEIVLTDSTR